MGLVLVGDSILCYITEATPTIGTDSTYNYGSLQLISLAQRTACSSSSIKYKLIMNYMMM